jgi:hypothetical protein
MAPAVRKLVAWPMVSPVSRLAWLTSAPNGGPNAATSTQRQARDPKCEIDTDLTRESERL